jgi:hypothetical protein
VFGGAEGEQFTVDFEGERSDSEFALDLVVSARYGERVTIVSTWEGCLHIAMVGGSRHPSIVNLPG